MSVPVPPLAACSLAALLPSGRPATVVSLAAAIRACDHPPQARTFLEAKVEGARGPAVRACACSACGAFGHTTSGGELVFERPALARLLAKRHFVALEHFALGLRELAEDARRVHERIRASGNYPLATPDECDEHARDLEAIAESAHQAAEALGEQTEGLGPALARLPSDFPPPVVGW